MEPPIDRGPDQARDEPHDEGEYHSQDGPDLLLLEVAFGDDVEDGVQEARREANEDEKIEEEKQEAEFI